IHIDIDPANIGKNVTPALSIAADAKQALEEFLVLTRECGEGELQRSIEKREPWWDRIRDWQRSQPLRYSGSRQQIKPQSVIRELHRLTQGNAIITTDVGQHQMWVAQFYPFTKTRQLITRRTRNDGFW